MKSKKVEKNAKATKPPPALPQKTEPAHTSLQAAIEESNRAIASAPGVKRGPGRPRKVEESATKPEEKVEQKSEAPKENIIVPSAALEGVVNFPFKAVALKTGWAGWELTEQEKKDNAMLLDLCLKQYLPQLESEHAALIGLSLGLGMAAVSRYMAFQTLLREHRAHSAKRENSGVRESNKNSGDKSQSKPVARDSANLNEEGIPGEALSAALNDKSILV